jgi:trk system potassium uptake protein TrkA
MVKMYPPKAIRDVPLSDTDIRKKFGVTVVGVKSPGTEFTYATPATVISNRDLIIVSGNSGQIEKFAAQQS